MLAVGAVGAAPRAVAACRRRTAGAAPRPSSSYPPIYFTRQLSVGQVRLHGTGQAQPYEAWERLVSQVFTLHTFTFEEQFLAFFQCSFSIYGNVNNQRGGGGEGR